MATKDFYATNSWYRPNASRWAAPLDNVIYGGRTATQGKDYRVLIYFGDLGAISNAEITKIELYLYRCSDGQAVKKSWLGQIADSRDDSGNVNAISNLPSITFINRPGWNVFTIDTSYWSSLIKGKYLHFYSTALSQYAGIRPHSDATYRPYMRVTYNPVIIPAKPSSLSFTPQIIEPNYKDSVKVSWSAASNAVKYRVQFYSETDGWKGGTDHTTTSYTDKGWGNWPRGIKVGYRVCAVSSTGHTSAWQENTGGTINRLPSSPTINWPAQEGAITYCSQPRFLCTMGQEPDKQDQTLQLSLDIGATTNVQSGKKQGETVYYKDSVIRVPGSHTVKVQSLDTSSAASGFVERKFTIAQVPFVSVRKGEKIRAEHVAGLVQMVDHLRTYYGMPAYQWNESVPQKGQKMKASFILQIRNAVEEIVNTINSRQSGAITLPADWTADEIAPGKPIFAQHIQRIRDVLVCL